MAIAVGILVVVVVVVGLGGTWGIVMWANRRPHHKKPRASWNPTGVAGGVHVGDRRSLSPPRDEVVEPADPQQSEYRTEPGYQKSDDPHGSGQS
ncbi:MAG TPA: hypothetical protein VHY58_21645 [Streptosporangiaceae bacterium]|jgi:hypothetical protein|nr:hypothetical protein [Streptosporangiaceae bacterium]